MHIDLAGQGEEQIGPGTWRINPQLTVNEEFQQLLSETLGDHFGNLPQDTDKQVQWETVKTTVKILAQQQGKQVANRVKSKEQYLQNRLQNRRKEIIHRMKESPTPSDHLWLELEETESAIAELLERQTEILCMRSAARWHEKGERSNKYFYGLLKHRTQAQCINHLYDAETNRISISKTNDLLVIASKYYKNLFSPEPVVHADMEHMTNSIPDNICLQDVQSKALLKPKSLADLNYTITSSPKNKSPGLDGLPFEIYNLLISHTYTKNLLLTIMNEAMRAKFPPSWQKTKLILLYTKEMPQG
jgi:hypothetical protein